MYRPGKGCRCRAKMSRGGFYPAIEPDFLRAVDVLVGITCVLSILGASLIILTYGAYRELRTTTRELLVNLSVADWILTASHFVGIFHYRTFIPQYNPHYDGNTDTLCSALGATDMFGTIASFLWTIALAGYMFTVIVLRRVRLAKCLVIPFYIICWGIPLALTIWFGIEDFYGFVETVDVISCYVRNVTDDLYDPKNVYVFVLSYDGWSYLTFVTLPAFYLAIFCYMRWKRARAHNVHPFSLSSWMSADIDLKLLLIPFIFLLLRMWGTIIDVVYLFLTDDDAEHLRHSKVIAAVVLLAAIGNSAQGAANAILFCVFTRQVRRRLSKTIKSIGTCLTCGHCRQSHSDQWVTLPDPLEPTTLIEDSLEPKDSWSNEDQSRLLVDVSTGSTPRSSTSKTYDSSETSS